MSIEIEVESCTIPLVDDKRLQQLCGLWQKQLAISKDISGYAGPGLKRHAARLLARMLARERSGCAFSYSGSTAFCAHADGSPIAVDAVNCNEGNAGSIVDFLKRSGLGITHRTDSAILRSWSVCEALLKLSGNGITWPGLKNIASLPVWQRCGHFRASAGTVHWRAMPLPGHWLCVAAYQDPNIKYSHVHYMEPGIN